MIRFSTLHEEASENGLVFSDYLCPRKRRFLISRFKRSRHNIASTKITLLLPLLLQRRLSDDARTRILAIPSTTALHAQATHRRSVSKEAKLVGGPFTSQGVVPLCSRSPVVRVGERSMWDGDLVVVVVVVVIGVNQESCRHRGR